MNITENIKIALSAVRNNLLRSFLTVLIIAIGIMALVGILASIDALLLSLNSNFSSLGANTFSVERSGEGISGNRRRGRSKRGAVITYRQATEFKERFDFPAKVSLSLNASSLATIKHKDEKTNPNVSVLGIDENYLDIRGFDLATGRNFSRSEIQAGNNRILLGMDIVKLLFDGNEKRAVGADVSIGSLKYKVVGVLKSKGASMSSNEDRQVLIPLFNAKKYYENNYSNYNVAVLVSDATRMDDAISSATGLFRNVRRLKVEEENDFEISKSDGLLQILDESTFEIQIAAIVIAMVTLLGAAIGLMNIMLVSVTERTKEIGIRKAIGATRQTILGQFLTEALVICIIGGLVGVFLGAMVGNIISLWLGGFFLFPAQWILLGLTMCFVVGVISGIYPAIKASKLDPIEALRYE